MLSHQEYNEAKENLQRAFDDIKRYHSASFGFNRAELNFSGTNAIFRQIYEFQSEIQDIVNFIEREERLCNDYLERYCPDFYRSLDSAVSSQWNKDEEQREQAKTKVDETVKSIDAYVTRKSQSVARDFQNNTPSGFFSSGQTWGTAIRQRLALAVGLKKEVNSIWTLGLNSIANSSSVTLGSHFVELLKKDPAIDAVVEEIEDKIVSDIKSQTYKAPYRTVQKIDKQSFSGRSRSVGFGGERHSDSMMQQLRMTILSPLESLEKYADTWRVGTNELTWTIRNASVQYHGIYHAVYNVHGFAFVWELEFAIEDVLDLRPRSGGNINFSGKTSGEKAYNIATSILGTAYHDILGNTDKLKVRVHWNQSGTGGNKIHSW